MNDPVVFVPDLEAWERMGVARGFQAAGIAARAGSSFRIDERALIDQIDGVRVLVVALAPVTARVIAKAGTLGLIAKAGIGTDNIDLAAARRRGIRVTRTPAVNVDGVVEYTIGAMVALAREFVRMDAAVRRGEWTGLRQAHSGLQPDLRGETLGIIGLGGIGRRLADLAAALGMTALACDPLVAAESTSVPLVPMESVLERARFVSVNALLSDETYHLIGEPELRRMRRDGYLVNSARGPIVDTSALARALEEGWIAGAAIDVHEDEPPPADHPLLRAPNCILTPHLAGATAGGYANIGQLVVSQVASFLAGRPLDPRHVVV